MSRFTRLIALVQPSNRNILQITSKNGEDQWEFNPKDKAQVEAMIKKVEEKIKKGWYLYGAKKGDKKMKLLHSGAQIKKEELTRFMIVPNAKVLATPPPVGG